MLTALPQTTGDALPRGANSRRRRFLRTLSDFAYVLLGPAESAAMRRDVMQRALIAGVIIAVLPIQQMRIPGWPAVVIGCAVAQTYNVGLAYLVYVKERPFAARILGLSLDSAVLMSASLYVFHEMGAAGSSSDIWLVFVVYIVTGGFTLAPGGSLLYTALWVSWFALGTVLYFPVDSQFNNELPIRMVFLTTLGVVALGMARELEKRRSKLVEQNRQTMNMLATLVEARDTDVGAHLHRIQHFSRALALNLGMAPREAQEIADASLTHDVGKAHVPDAVLRKAGPLNPDEWQAMQAHTAWSDRLFTENSDFEIARQVARWHHEHWDGGGYPDGLAGTQIPLAARIVAIADVYDALISKRPYKDAWSPLTAIGELQRMAGSHLDPQLVPAFVNLWERGIIQQLTEQVSETPATNGANGAHFDSARAA
jgi:HD-GYP domain-containing protein (c-di-GMP phosphodiesterase class II)